MAEADSSIASLRSRLAGLAQMLGGEPELAVGISVSSPRAKGRPAAAAQPPAAARAVKSPPARQAHFQPTVRPAVLRAANTRASDAPLGGLLQKYRDAEAAWLKEKGRLMLAAKGEQQRRAKAEGELRRVQEQLAFRLGEVKHLKAALRGRDGQLVDLQDRLRLYELEEGGERTAQETVRQAQAERDELRGAMRGLLERLEAANAVIAQADASMAALEARAAAAAEERQAAEEAAEAARAEAERQREAAADLQLKCGLLERLAELTLHQNEEKTATLQALLNSEGLLEDAAERGQQRASLGGEDGGGDGLGGGDSSSDGSV